MEKAGLIETQRWIRSVTDLRGLDEKELWRRLGNKTRNIRKAERAKLNFEDITKNDNASQVYYRLHLKTQRNLGIPPFPRKFFDLMIECLSSVGRLRLFAVTDLAGVPIAAMIILLEGNRAIYAYGASDPNRRETRPNDFLFYNVLRWAISCSFDEFDMGSDAPEQESLLFFKRKYLADQVAIPVYSSQGLNTGGSDSSAFRYKLARQFLRHLPEGLTAPLLSRAVRYFG